MSSTVPTVITTKVFEHTTEMINSTESPSSTIMPEENNHAIEDSSPSTFPLMSSTMNNFEATTPKKEMTSTEFSKTNQTNIEEQNHFTTVNAEDLSTVSITSNHPRLFDLLSNLSQNITTENPFDTTMTENNITSTTST